MPNNRDIAALLAVLIVFAVSVEGLTHYWFGRVSRIERRREQEYRGALAVRSGKNRNAESILVVGNSLLLEGVNFPELQRDSGDGVEFTRLVVENTSYLDWYYGLRRLFKKGAQPDWVVLVLNPTQLTSDATDGDYTAHLLLAHDDLLKLAADVRADRNRTSSLALANLSFFYGNRAEIRSWILGKILPDFENLTHSLHSSTGVVPKRNSSQLASRRLVQLRETCQRHGVRPVVVIPPATADAGASELVQAAEGTGVSVVVPIAPGTLPRSDFSDNFHLNSSGAGKFTPVLAANLKRVFSPQIAAAQTAMAPVPLGVNRGAHNVNAKRSKQD
ncbi:MAG TPA: hypothetical protein VND65_16510 [Candidatus Binatia bacterium]|nr:hypothetical protein [Candidatus Binatia bacterium]